MIIVFKNWFHRYFTDPQAIILAVLLIIGFAIILNLGGMLAPVLAAIVIAYLLEGLVRFFQHYGFPRMLAVILVFLVFMVSLLFILFGLLPLLSHQLTQLIEQIPEMVSHGQQLLLLLPDKYPDIINIGQVRAIMDSMRVALGELGQSAVVISLASLQGVMMLLVYLFLVPFLVFFFLKDKVIILGYLGSLLPKERQIVSEVWKQMNTQIASYVRGKLLEVLIVWVACYVAFAFMGLHYASLLSFLVGLSVIIPYMGAAAVTVPVILIGYFQWGWTSEYLWMLTVYGVIQAVDGNIIVPIMFSEVVNLHPVAIMVAVLFFGGIWGFWGVFFAIPLATLVQVVISCWPRTPVSLALEDS